METFEDIPLNETNEDTTEDDTFYHLPCPHHVHVETYPDFLQTILTTTDKYHQHTSYAKFYLQKADRLLTICQRLIVYAEKVQEGTKNDTKYKVLLTDVRKNVTLYYGTLQEKANALARVDKYTNSNHVKCVNDLKQSEQELKTELKKFMYSVHLCYPHYSSFKNSQPQDTYHATARFLN